MQWLAVLNPRSAHFKDRQAIDALSAALEDALGSAVTIKVSSCVGHVHRLARKHSTVAGFIGLGGDGTLFDLINGMNRKTQRLAIVPVGTGNGLARDVGITTVDQALGLLRSGGERRMDLMRVGIHLRGGERLSWHAASTVSVGYAAAVVETANAYCKLLGPFCYPVASTLRSFFTTPVCGRWQRDGEGWQPLDATNVLVNNTRHAGNFEVFPQASIDDGQLDVLVARAGGLGQMAHNLSILTGCPVHATGVPRQARQLEFDFDEEQMVMLDGEIRLGVTSMTVRIEPGALRLQA